MSRAHLITGRASEIGFPVVEKPKPIYSKGEFFCPRCGNPLLLRQGRYGDFLGCTKYPSCLYTAKKKKGR